MKWLGFGFLAVLLGLWVAGGREKQNQVSVEIKISPTGQITTTPVPAPGPSVNGIFMRFDQLSGAREILIKEADGNIRGYGVSDKITFMVSPPNVNVDGAYLEAGDNIHIDTENIYGKLTTVVSLIDYTERPDLMQHMLKEDLYAGATQKETTQSQISATTGWNTYDKNFNGVHFHFMYPDNLKFEDRDSSGPISFQAPGADNIPKDVFQVDRGWFENSFDGRDFLLWYRANGLLNYGERITGVELVKLPKNKVYKVSFAYDKVPANDEYILFVSNAIIRLEKTGEISDQDFYAVVNSIKASCKVECPK